MAAKVEGCTVKFGRRYFWLVSGVVWMGSLLFFVFIAHYPWQFAMLLATALGALAYSILSTTQHMRQLAQPRGIDPDNPSRKN